MIRTPVRTLRRLGADRSGLALLEFAFSMPMVLGIGLYGVETANLALANLRVSQAALNLADNAARVGSRSNLASVQLREIDINDVLAQVRTQSSAWQLTTRGRVTLSSLENSAGVQRIHWQRCLGMKNGTNWDSSYGATTPTAGSDTNLTNQGTLTPLGMGPAGSQVNAPPNSGVMFVEVNFDYRPVVSTLWLPGGSARIQYIASFVVRDRRDFAQVYNPSPTATRMSCEKYST